MLMEGEGGGKGKSALSVEGEKGDIEENSISKEVFLLDGSMGCASHLRGRHGLAIRIN